MTRPGDNSNDTICAMATAPGGAIGVIRVSGPQAIAHTGAIFRPAGKRGGGLEQALPHSLVFGHIVQGDDIIDEVLVSVFRAPRSYTGEDSTEISCHGSPFILQRVLQLLVEQGCRMAGPGEYTQRAFLNGKMDLSQAEAVADLIASSSAAAHRLAMNQMRGGFSRELRDLRDRLLHFASLIELELDFSDHEDIEFANRAELEAAAAHIEEVMSRLADSFRTGDIIKRGVPVAIVGETNSGKSTLLNALLNEEKAIVSHISGTTRDVIEDTTVLDGVTFRLCDTAGIRDTNDTIEAMGIGRTFLKMEQAQVILWVIDTTRAEEQIRALAGKILPHCQDKPLLLALNKEDQLPEAHNAPFIPVQSGKDGQVAESCNGTDTMACGKDGQAAEAHTTPFIPAPSGKDGQAAESCNGTDTMACGKDGQAAESRNGTDIPMQSGKDGQAAESRNGTDAMACGKGNQLAGSSCPPLPGFPPATHVISISAKHRRHIDGLKRLLVEAAQIPAVTQADVIVTNARHHEALQQALAAMRRARHGLAQNLPGDLLAQDIRECTHHLADIVGEITSDLVLQNIFERFCIGK